MTTIRIIWITYNPYTGDCLYAGTDLEQARLALATKPMQGYIVYPAQAAMEPEPVKRTRKAAK